jgi:hypothetical protein
MSGYDHLESATGGTWRGGGKKPVPMSPYPPQIPHGLVMASILPVARKESSNKLYKTTCSLRNVAFLHTVRVNGSNRRYEHEYNIVMVIFL